MRRAPLFSFVAFSLSVALATSTSSCFDPVHSKAVEELGPEVDGIPRGRFHRAGQPCTTCHGGSGPGAPPFSVAGTIYQTRSSRNVMQDVAVTITDSSNPPETRVRLTNEAGNFYIEEDSWSPTFPLFVSLSHKDVKEPTRMLTRIGGSGGCAVCHYAALDDPTVGNNSPLHMPPVYMSEPK